MRCGKGFPSPELSADILRNGGGRKTFPPFVCLAAESYHNLHKVWSNPKLNRLPSFVLVADVKAISLTTGIGTHDSRAVLQPLEEFVALIGRPFSAYSEENIETQHHYYESHYACDITPLICNFYILNNVFTTYTNYVCATFLPFVQEYRECDVRRLRDNEGSCFL